MRKFFTLLVISFAALAVGCGGSQEPQVADDGGETASSSDQGFQAVRPAKQYSDPRESINDFLVAVKTGDDNSATALLTTDAQREAWTHGLAISAEGFPDAKFEVSEVEYLEENTEARVMSVWENKSQYGKEKSFQCVWFLRAESHGWCVYGMATKFLDHIRPAMLNFENQVAMQKEQAWAQQQIENYAALQQSQQQQLQAGTHGPTAPVGAGAQVNGAQQQQQQQYRQAQGQQQYQQPQGQSTRQATVPQTQPLR